MIYVSGRHWFWSKAKSVCSSIQSARSPGVVAEYKWLNLDVAHLHLNSNEGSLLVAAERETESTGMGREWDVGAGGNSKQDIVRVRGFLLPGKLDEARIYDNFCPAYRKQTVPSELQCTSYVIESQQDPL